MLNEKGKLIGDFTIAKAGDGHFYMWGSSQAQIYHMRWFEQHLPKDGSVRIERLDMGLVGLSIAGPKSREVLQQLTDEDVSNAAFKFMDHRSMEIAHCPALINRVTYTGDLGYEIWVQPEYQRRLYQEIMRAGEVHGIVNFGMRALLCMRLEKNFPTWFRELRPIYGGFEAGMDRFIDLTKNDFIGRDAAMELDRRAADVRAGENARAADTRRRTRPRSVVAATSPRSGPLPASKARPRTGPTPRSEAHASARSSCTAQPCSTRTPGP